MDPEPSSFLFFLSVLKPFQIELLIPLGILLFLLLASALISGSEVAFFSLQSKDLENHPGKKGSLDGLIHLLDQPRRLLATILISNNFINVGIVILSAFITDQLFDFSANPSMGFVVQVVAITFLILLFGEVLPKVYATKNALSFGLFMTGPMKLMMKVFQPLSLLLVRSGSFLEKRLQKRSENLSVDELSQALEITSNEDSTEQEQKILEGIVKFGSTTVKQVMTSRMDVVAVDISWDYKKVLSQILESGYSRIPVYEEDQDQVRGMLYIKDLIPHIEKDANFKWQDLLREAFFVPENKKIDDLLREFQEKKIHISVVVDEYGGTSGVITLEDVIEEIVGEISDEFDDEDLVYSKLDELNYVFEGKTHLNDFFKVMHLDEELFEEYRDEADTLAGLLLELFGKFPEKGEEIDFENLSFKVESLDGRRLKRIKVTRNEDLDEED